MLGSQIQILWHSFGNHFIFWDILLDIKSINIQIVIDESKNKFRFSFQLIEFFFIIKLELNFKKKKEKLVNRTLKKLV